MQSGKVEPRRRGLEMRGRDPKSRHPVKSLARARDLHWRFAKKKVHPLSIHLSFNLELLATTLPRRTAPAHSCRKCATPDSQRHETMTTMPLVTNGDSADALILSDDPHHPANHICTLCAHFYSLGWVTGTGGGTSIKRDGKIYIAPSGVQKELMAPTDIFVAEDPALHPDRYPAGKRIDHRTMPYLRRPASLSPSACTPLFLAAFMRRGAACCIHTHSQWTVLVTLLLESSASPDVFEIQRIEQIKGIPAGRDRAAGNLGYFDTLRVPVIENTAKEEDLTESLERAMDEYPDTYAVLVRRHGIYVWGEDVARAKTICESLDYIFRLAVEMRKLGIPWMAS